MKDLIYVTGNESKIFSAKKLLEPYGINVIAKEIDCIEIQADKIEDVTEPGKETKVFYSKTEGVLDTKKSCTYGWSWDRIFIPNGQTKSMANFDDDERFKLWSDEGYKKLAEYLNKNN